MNPEREQAIKDVAEGVGLYPNTIEQSLRNLSDDDNLSFTYALEQRLRVIQLERALRDCMNSFNMTRLIMPPDAAKQAAEIIAGYRDLLEGK